MINNLFSFKTLFAISLSTMMSSCPGKDEKQTEEQVAVSGGETESTGNDSLFNSVTGNVTMKQVASFPNKVILTGLNDHRLVSIYKSTVSVGSAGNATDYKYDYDSDESGDESSRHFMPGIDILFGYNLLNIAHYDFKSEKGNFLFNHPVLVKTVYYPSLEQDSLDKLPVNRDFYLLSVYDEDTNKDTLINKKDLRRFYHFDAGCSVRTQIIPANYSVLRSQYDPKNDVMYIFARLDENKNGTQEKSEPVHVFWFSLKTPGKAKRLY
ncbi:MAG: hypothetical protein JWO44_673 [Bacteroidetes bacterium]|nr:hypothetical protein [Bacteroidota bacterium]